MFILLLQQCYRSPTCQFTVMRHTNLKTYQAQQLRKFSTRRHRRLVNDSATLYQALRSKEFESHSAKYVSNSTVSDAQDKGPHNIAVIGGGITGLTSAFYLSQELPNANITIYEGSERLGGWLRSKHVNTGNGDIVFEQGPRTLRPGTPAGLVVLNLVCINIVYLMRHSIDVIFRSRSSALRTT